MGAQMSLPHVPLPDYDFMASFSWTNFNLGLVKSVFASKYTSRARRRLAAANGSAALDDDRQLYGIDKYCAQLGIEAEDFMVDILLGIAVAAAALIVLGGIPLILAKRRVRGLRSEKLKGSLSRGTPQQVSSADILSFVVGVVHQIRFYADFRGPSDPRYYTARGRMIVGIFSLAAVLYFFATLFLSRVLHKRMQRVESSEKRRASLKLSSTISTAAALAFKPAADRLGENYRKGCKMFWISNLRRQLVSGVSVAALSAPRPVQAIVILGLSTIFLSLVFWMAPYKLLIAHRAQVLYALLLVANGAIFVVMGTEDANLSARALKKLGRAQMIMNIAAVLVFTFIVVVNSLRIYSMKDFKARLSRLRTSASMRRRKGLGETPEEEEEKVKVEKSACPATDDGGIGISKAQEVIHV